MSSMAGAVPGGSAAQTQPVSIPPTISIYLNVSNPPTICVHSNVPSPPTVSVHRNVSSPSTFSIHVAAPNPQIVPGPLPQTVMGQDGQIWTLQAPPLGPFPLASTEQPPREFLYVTYGREVHGGNGNGGLNGAPGGAGQVGGSGGSIGGGCGGVSGEVEIGEYGSKYIGFGGVEGTIAFSG